MDGGNNYTADTYGTGQLIADFENKVATLLANLRHCSCPAEDGDFDCAASGRTARTTRTLACIKPRIWNCTRSSRTRSCTACAGAFGKGGFPILAADLQYYDVPLSAIVLELPMREIGGQLPLWEDLVKQRDIAKSRSTKLHLDGARLWETRAFYRDQSYADIAALFDLVYVSFYKGIGGLAGAMLLGDEAFIAEARVWLTRHGGTIFQQYPLWPARPCVSTSDWRACRNTLRARFRLSMR